MIDCAPFRRINCTTVLDETTGFRHVECEACGRIVAVFDPDLDHHWTEHGLTVGDVRLLEPETHHCSACRKLCTPEELTYGCEHSRMAELEVYPGFIRRHCKDCGHRWLTHAPRALHGRWIQTNSADDLSGDGRRPNGPRDAQRHEGPNTTAAE